MKKLRTDRSAVMFLLISGLTFLLWIPIGSRQLAQDINTIMSRYDGKKTKPSGIIINTKESVFTPYTMDRINTELLRRGIKYQVKNPYLHIFTALNLLSEDYNRNGC